MKFEIQLTGIASQRTHVVELERQGPGYRVLLDGRALEADATQVSPNTISVLLGGQAYEVHVTPALDGTVKLQSGAHEFTAGMQDPRAWRGRKQGAMEAEGRQQIIAPMPGKVIRLLVAAGDEVAAGQGLVVVEAMKMQNEIRSPKKGKVERVLAKEGQNVNAGEVLAWVD
jgi:biotin carboxyl carrier protein